MIGQTWLRRPKRHPLDARPILEQLIRPIQAARQPRERIAAGVWREQAAGLSDRAAPKLRAVTNNRAKLFAPEDIGVAIWQRARRLGMRQQWKVGREATASKMRLVAEEAVATIAIVRQLARIQSEHML